MTEESPSGLEGVAVVFWSPYGYGVYMPRAGV